MMAKCCRIYFQKGRFAQNLPLCLPQNNTEGNHDYFAKEAVLQTLYFKPRFRLIN